MVISTVGWKMMTESDERINQFLKIVGRSLLKYLFTNKENSREFWIREIYGHYNIDNI